MSCQDKLQQVWQSQPDGKLGINSNQLLKLVRHEQRALFWCDVVVISVFLGVGVLMLRAAFRDIQHDWPWLISAASDVWVVGYILFNRRRQQRHAAHYDEPLLAHVEWSIKDIEHQMWLQPNTLWWYILPIALGCMIPPVLFFAMDDSQRPLVDRLIPLLGIEAIFAAIFCFVHWVMKYGRRKGLERQRQELQALQALRESLLHTEE